MFTDDVWPSASLLEFKETLLTTGYSKCDEFIADFKQNKLQTQVGIQIGDFRSNESQVLPSH